MCVFNEPLGFTFTAYRTWLERYLYPEPRLTQLSNIQMTVIGRISCLQRSTACQNMWTKGVVVWWGSQTRWNYEQERKRHIPNSQSQSAGEIRISHDWASILTGKDLDFSGQDFVFWRSTQHFEEFRKICATINHHKPPLATLNQPHAPSSSSHYSVSIGELETDRELLKSSTLAEWGWRAGDNSNQSWIMVIYRWW